jgi:drug/metabolite transporter (DMT)-like permease
MMLFCVLVTALAGAATKQASTLVPISMVVFVQYCIALLLVIPSVLKKGLVNIRTPFIGLHILRGLSGWLCFYFYYLAISKIPLVEASLLRSASPLCVPIILLVMKTESFAAKRWWPILLGLIGISLILKPESGMVSGWHLVGFMSAVTLALSMVLTRQLALAKEPASRILFYYFFISMLCSLPLMLVQWVSPSPEAVLWMLSIGVAIYIALQFYTEAYRLAEAGLISPFSYFGVVFSGLLGWLIWGQVPDVWTFAGILLVFIGGVWTVRVANNDL